MSCNESMHNFMASLCNLINRGVSAEDAVAFMIRSNMEEIDKSDYETILEYYIKRNQMEVPPRKVIRDSKKFFNKIMEIFDEIPTECQCEK